jgi:hypothetical protein
MTVIKIENESESESIEIELHEVHLVIMYIQLV